MKANYEVPKQEANVVMGDLYSVNKQLMKNEPLMTKQEIEDAIGEVSGWIKEVVRTNDRYFMLLCHERRDYTLFNLCRIGGMTYVDTANLDIKPIVQNGRTLVPVRFISEKMGAGVGWIDATQTVTVQTKAKDISLQIGSNEMLVNGEKIITRRHLIM